MKNLFLILIGVWLFCIFGFSTYHNWHLTTPEILSDPVNWVLAGVLIVIGFLITYWGSKGE